MSDQKTNAFDLDAILGELAPREPLKYRGQSFTLPQEFPAACLTPFLNKDLGLVQLIVDTIESAGENDSWMDMVTSALKKAPMMPLDLIEAARQSFATLLDVEAEGQYAEFEALKPSVQAYVLIARAIVNEYGVSLTDFFGSDEPSEEGSGDSNLTSSSTTDSTPAASGDTPTTPASSD